VPASSLCPGSAAVPEVRPLDLRWRTSCGPSGPRHDPTGSESASHAVGRMDAESHRPTPLRPSAPSDRGGPTVQRDARAARTSAPRTGPPTHRPHAHARDGLSRPGGGGKGPPFILAGRQWEGPAIVRPDLGPCLTFPVDRAHTLGLVRYMLKPGTCCYVQSVSGKF
jgi:hypothetical protein